MTAELFLPWPARVLSPKYSRWTADEDAALARLPQPIDYAAVVPMFGRNAAAIKNRAYRLGLLKDKVWTDDDLTYLRQNYDRVPLDMASIADHLGRSVNAVAVKAGRLGLANQRRPKKRPEDIVPKRKYATLEEARKASGAATKERIQRCGHPRGAAGMKHSEKTKMVMSEKSKAMWADPNCSLRLDANRQRLSDNMAALAAAGKLNSKYSRTRGGKREDLGNRYFRSAWEANYARYLNFLAAKGEISGWEYEPKTFEFEKIKRGTRTYTPDFRVDEVGGGHVWHEVKGWMDEISKVRLARFARYFPEEKLIVVDGAWFKSANRTIAALIPGWETGTVHV